MTRHSASLPRLIGQARDREGRRRRRSLLLWGVLDHLLFGALLLGAVAFVGSIGVLIAPVFR